MNSDKTPYELWYGKPPTTKHFRVFGSKCYIKINNDKLGKSEAIDDEGILLGYYSRRKWYKCYNKILQSIVECIDVVIDEASTGMKKEAPIDEKDPLKTIQNNGEEIINEASNEGSDNTEVQKKTPSRYVQKNHPESQILGGKESGKRTRRTLVGTASHLALLSTIEPQNVNQVSKGECCVKAMNE